MTIRADLHVHAKVCKSSRFDRSTFDNSVEQALRTGLSGFALTEHFHAPDYWGILDELAGAFPYDEGRLRIADGFGVLTGAELTVAEGGDVVLIGEIQALMGFDSSFGPRPSSGYRPPLADVFGPARRAGLIVIAAHPTRSGKGLIERCWDLLPLFDALEVNGKDVGLSKTSVGVRALAELIGRPVVGGSDAHAWPQVGTASTVLDLEELTMRGLERCLSQRTTAIETTANISSMVRICKAHKAVARRSLSSREKRTTRSSPSPVAVPVGG